MYLIDDISWVGFDVLGMLVSVFPLAVGSCEKTYIVDHVSVMLCPNHIDRVSFKAKFIA